MPGLKTKDVREMSPDEQQKQLNEAHQELFNLRFQLATRQLQNYRRIREVRRNIARLNGIIAQQAAAEQAEA